jgi:HSP20 family protein
MLLRKWQPRIPSLELVDPFAEVARFRRGIDLLLDEACRLAPGIMTVTEGSWRPRVDVSETDERILVRAELPGVKQEDIQVSIQNGTLTLKGERKLEREVNESPYSRIERSYGTFERRMVLPPVVNPDEAKATYKDGVLEIQLPKKEEAKPKGIKVETA